VIKKDYPWNRVKRIGIVSFDSRYKQIKGVEDIFAKFLIQEGFDVIERHKIEHILKEQKMSMEGVFVPSGKADAGQILGVDVLLLGNVVSFVPDKKHVGQFHLTDKTEEPVFKKVTEKNSDGIVTEVIKQIGTKTTYTDKNVEKVLSVYSQIGIVAKLVDIKTGEIIWVNTYNGEGDSPLSALENAVSYLVKILVSDIKKTKIN
jgi:curli biogenesis system outer membrane secretion channel CsgG